MFTSQFRRLLLVRLFLVIAVVTAIFLACAAPEPTPTPIPPASAVPPVAPTVAPAPTATPISGAPTPVLATPTPTRVLPTPTPSPAAKPIYGGVVRFALTSSFDNFDPAFSTETGFQNVQYSIYNNLVDLRPDGSIGPELARSWDFSADGKTVTFHLAAGVKFQDGTPLDARAAKWSFDRLLAKEVGSPWRSQLTPPLQRVDVVDDQTIRFYLSEPFRPLLATLNERPGQFASPTAVERLKSYADRNGEFGRRPVGSGPFKLKEWVPSSHVSLERNESYWEKGVPYFDAARLPIVPDKIIQFAMLRTGELDLMDEVRAADALLAERIPNIRIIKQEGARHRSLRFRLTKEPWNKKALREAFAYAMDRDTLVRVLYEGLAIPAHNPIGPVYGVWYDPAIKMYEYSPQKAREKLAEAGNAGGFSYVFPCRANPFELQWCETIQVMLANVGIKTQIQPWEVASFFSDFNTGKHDGPFVSGIFARGDLHVNLFRWFHTKGASNVSSRIGYSNLEFDKLIEEAAAVYDVAKGKELYRKALTLLGEDSPVAFLLFETDLYGVSAKIRNFAPRATRNVGLRELWLSG